MFLYAFKNVRNMEKFLEENANAEGGTQPILTRETMAYAIHFPSVAYASMQTTIS